MTLPKGVIRISAASSGEGVNVLSGLRRLMGEVLTEATDRPEETTTV